MFWCVQQLLKIRSGFIKFVCKDIKILNTFGTFAVTWTVSIENIIFTRRSGLIMLYVSSNYVRSLKGS